MTLLSKIGKLSTMYSSNFVLKSTILYKSLFPEKSCSYFKHPSSTSKGILGRHSESVGLNNIFFYDVWSSKRGMLMGDNNLLTTTQTISLTEYRKLLMMVVYPH